MEQEKEIHNKHSWVDDEFEDSEKDFSAHNNILGINKNMNHKYEFSEEATKNDC